MDEVTNGWHHFKVSLVTEEEAVLVLTVANFVQVYQMLERDFPDQQQLAEMCY